MPDNKPTRKAKNQQEKPQGQYVARQAGPNVLKVSDPNYPKEAFGMMVSQESMSGPLPSPKLVAGYNEVIHNGGERIMVMAEKEQDGRLAGNKNIEDINLRAIKGYNFRGAFSQIAATILVIFLLGLGGYLGLNGQPDLAKDIFRYTIGSVVVAFLGGQAAKLVLAKKETGDSDNPKPGEAD